jgi:2-polyprenyl-3-methyl-5-hydroxy-6-metoxy-1,4-benzoquinol methylase
LHDLKRIGRGTIFKGFSGLLRNDPAAGIDRMFEFVSQPTCQVCGSAEKRPFAMVSQYKEKKFVWRDVEFKYVLCNTCGFVYMDPVPTGESYAKFYRDYYWYVQTSAIATLAQKASERTVRAAECGSMNSMRNRRIPRIQSTLVRAAPQLNSESRVLEIGCGWGSNLAYLHEEYGVNVLAVEPSEQARSFIRREYPFIELVGSVAEDLYGARHFDGTIDVVIFSHCLEMILDQNKIIAAIHRLLSPNGILYIDTPNLFWQRALHPTHPFVYSSETLLRFLAKHDFSVQQMKFSPLPADSLARSLLMFVRKKDPYLTAVARKRTAEEMAVLQEASIAPDEVVRRWRVGQRVLLLTQLPMTILHRGILAPLKRIKRLFVPARIQASCEAG